MATVQNVYQALNDLRRNPRSYVPHLEQMLKYFKGNTLYVPGQIGLVTSEGPSAVQECISFLQRTQPLPDLQLDNYLCKAAQEHADDIGPKGLCDHTGSNGSTMGSRISAQGKWSGHIGENIDFGGNRSGLDIILNLIIDDGVSSRGHRENCMSKDYKMVGIGLAPHKEYKGCCVFDFAQGFEPKGSSSSSSNKFNQPPSSHSHQFNQPPSFGQNSFNQPPSNQQSSLYNNMQLPSQTQQPQNYGSSYQQQYSYSSNTTNSSNPQGNFSQQQQMTGFNQPRQVQQQSNQDMPPGCVSMQTNTKTQISGNTKTVTTTTTYTMKDGSTRTETNTQTTTNY